MKTFLLILFAGAILSGCATSKISGCYSTGNKTVCITQTSDSTVILTIGTPYGSLADTLKLRKIK